VLSGRLLWHLDIQEYDYARDIINDVVLLVLPPQVALPNKSLSRSLSVSLLEIGIHDICHVFILEKLPHAVTSYDYKFIIFAHVQFQYF